MNILYIAYSCLPDKGSEEKIGWNIPLESAKSNNVIVVTKEEHRATIEKYVKEHKIENPKFYYVDIPGVYKKIFKGVAYSMRLNIWHKKALPMVKEICAKEKIDIIHQITPIEFRSIGNYHKIQDVKFVCGPLGGGEYIPRGLKQYAISNAHIELIRRILNFSYKAKFAITGQLKKCDYFLFANRETQMYLDKLVNNIPNELYFDNGLSESDINKFSFNDKTPKNKTVFLVAGRMAYRKGHAFLLDAIKLLPKEKEFEFRFVGGGPKLEKLKNITKKLNLENVVTFTGRISFKEMETEYKNADVFVMPSIRETTGAVLLEAACAHLPIIAINRFGGPVLYNDSSAYFYNGNNKKEFVNQLKNAILHCIENPDDVKAKAEAAAESTKEHTWNNKMKKYNSIYSLLSEK